MHALPVAYPAYPPRPSGLQEDCPFEGELAPASEAVTAPPPSNKKPSQFRSGSGGGDAPSSSLLIRPEDADRISDADFKSYCTKLYSYLQVVENRLFSEGLHVLGQPPSHAHMGQYLEAYFGGELPGEAVQVVVGEREEDGLVRGDG